jgi:predicted nucleic acid-binding protein
MKENETCFFDTNILVYAHDISEEEKWVVCNKLLSQVFLSKLNGAVSAQVLAEVFYVLTKKVKNPLDAEESKKIIFNFLKSENWLKISYDENTLEKAINTSIDVKIDLWDALIAETMKENGINKIYTENERDFKKIPRIKVINPLK